MRQFIAVLLLVVFFCLPVKAENPLDHLQGKEFAYSAPVSVVTVPEVLPEGTELIDYIDDTLVITRDVNNIVEIITLDGSWAITVEGEYWGKCAPLDEAYLFYDEKVDDIYMLTVDSQKPEILLTTLKVFCIK